jgi:hypothetical protein
MLSIAGWASGRPEVVRRGLVPPDLSDLPPPPATRPLMQLPPDALIASLGGDYVHAMVCKAALYAFAAENEARMEAMSAAGNQIELELDAFEAILRRVRQEAITAEIIELGAGAAAAWRRLSNRCSFKSSSRIRPLKDSTKPFCMGLPGRCSWSGNAKIWKIGWLRSS